MVTRVQTHVQNQLFVLITILGELLGGKPALKLHDLFEVVRNIRTQDHLGNDLAHIPVLCLRKQFKNVVLRVQQQLECDRAVMVLEHAAVVVTEGLCVLHGNQERIIDTRMGDVTAQTG